MHMAYYISICIYICAICCATTESWLIMLQMTLQQLYIGHILEKISLNEY